MGGTPIRILYFDLYLNTACTQYTTFISSCDGYVTLHIRACYIYACWGLQQEIEDRQKKFPFAWPVYSHIGNQHGGNCSISIKIHLNDIKQQQKEKVSRKLIKQSFCWTPSCKFKIQFTHVLLWSCSISRGVLIIHSIFMWTRNTPPCEPLTYIGQWCEQALSDVEQNSHEPNGPNLIPIWADLIPIWADLNKIIPPVHSDAELPFYS